MRRRRKRKGGVKVMKGEVENIDKRVVEKEVEENKTGVKSNKVDSILFAIYCRIMHF